MVCCFRCVIEMLALGLRELLALLFVTTPFPDYCFAPLGQLQICLSFVEILRVITVRRLIIIAYCVLVCCL